MAELSRFFDNTDTDTREYAAAAICGVLSDIISTGIVKGLEQALEIAPSGQGLSVNVSPGVAFINGFWYANTEAKTIQLDPVDSGRIDLIILRLDNDTGETSRKITAEKKTGAILQSDTCYELVIAEVSLQTGQTLVTADNIVDRRGASGSDYCPYATIPAIAHLLLTAAEISGLTSEGNTTLHTHDIYSLLGHNHDGSYSAINHNHNTLYALLTHNHNTAYAPLSHISIANIHTKITSGSSTPTSLENGQIYLRYS